MSAVAAAVAAVDEEPDDVVLQMNPVEQFGRGEFRIRMQYADRFQ